MLNQVEATEDALQLIKEIVADHGPVIFHQSGGCCDGSAPMCYAQGDLIIAEHDVQMGEIGGMPFYIGGKQYEAWKHTRLIIDVIDGRGGMFSLDNVNAGAKLRQCAGAIVHHLAGSGRSKSAPPCGM